MQSDEEELPIEALLNDGNANLQKQENESKKVVNNNDKDRQWLHISEYFKWFKSRLKSFIVLALVISTVLFTAAVCIIVWNFINHSLIVNDEDLEAHTPNQMDLYKAEDGVHIPLPKDDIIADTDVDDTDPYSLSGPIDMDPDKPTYTKAEMDELNLEAENDIVSHNDILHDDPFDDFGERHDTDQRIPLSKHRGFLEALRMEHNAIEDRIKAAKVKDNSAVTPVKLITEPIELLKATSSPSIGIIESNIFDNHSVSEEKEKILAKAVEISNILNKKKGTKEVPPGNPHPSRKYNQIKKPTVENARTRQSTTSPTENTSESPIMTLYKVTNAVRAGAVCLDGSPPAYYHRPGAGNSEKLWIVHFNGGAWCFDAKACFERAKSSLGSTKKLPPAPPIIQGINSPDPSINPDFYDWNLVWVVYCDGASFTGNREKPLVSDNGEIIYMRGKRVLNAIINDLLFNRNFKLAEAIILTGSSAGSMTAIFQADYIASKFPRTVPVRVLSDAGFFIETAPMGGKNLGAKFRQIYLMQNSSAGLNQDCVREAGLEKGWQCFFPSRTMKYVKTPMFVLNAAYDIWALIYFLDIDCKFPSIGKDKRKKRSVIQATHLRTDSELEMEIPFDDDIYDDSFLAVRKRRSLVNPNFQHENRFTQTKKRLRRDISGFEIQPFYRNFETDIGDSYSEDEPIKNIHSQKLPPTYRSLKSNISHTLNLNHSVKMNYTKHYPKKVDIHSLMINFADFFNIKNNKTRRLQNRQKIPYAISVTNNSPNKILSSSFQNLSRSSKNLPRSSKNLSRSTNNLSRSSTNLYRDTNNLSRSTNNLSRSSNNLSRSSNTLSRSSNQAILPNHFHHNKSIILDVPLVRNNSTDHKHNYKQNLAILPTIKLHKAVIYPKNDFQYIFNSELQSAKLRHIDKKREAILEKPPVQSYGTNNDFKRQNVKNSRHKNSKWRRSTSIAREYINILRSDPPECTEKEIFNTMKYRNAMIHATSNLLRLPKSGRFLVSCIDHSLSLFDETWTSLMVAGKSIQQAFGDWFYERGNKGKYDSVDCPYPCNPTCP